MLAAAQAAQTSKTATKNETLLGSGTREVFAAQSSDERPAGPTSLRSGPDDDGLKTALNVS